MNHMRIWAWLTGTHRRQKFSHRGSEFVLLEYEDRVIFWVLNVVLISRYVKLCKHTFPLKTWGHKVASSTRVWFTTLH